MKLYNTYGNAYNDAIALLTKLKEKDDFSQMLAACRGSNPLDLEALLIQPVQRIPRYRLLLEDLVKNTPASHPDKANLEASLSNIRDVANDINESIRATEQVKKVGENVGLQKYIAPHRKLLTEGFFAAKVSALDSDTKPTALDVAFYLFNDLLVIFFSKQVKLKDPRRVDVSELGWPASTLWASADGKAGFRVIGPWLQMVCTSKEKDSTAASSQVAGFLQRLTDAINENVNKDLNASGSNSQPKLQANPTPGTKYGIFEFPEGIKYAGEWKNGNFHGRGVVDYPGALRVEGTFDEGLMHGDCKIFFPTGEIYSGSCMKGVQHGAGQLVWPNGDVYQGYWLDGRRDGEGTFTCTFYKYTGSWVDGLMQGEGRLEFNRGGSYIGKFMAGRFHGDGVLMRANGTITRGSWVDGFLEGEAEEIYPETSLFKNYSGTFKADSREGQGTMVYRDGSQYKVSVVPVIAALLFFFLIRSLFLAGRLEAWTSPR